MPVFTVRHDEMMAAIDGSDVLDMAMKTALRPKVSEVRKINADLNEQIMKLVLNPGQFTEKAAFANAWNSAVEAATARLSGVFTSAPSGMALPEPFRTRWMKEIFVQEGVALYSARLEGWRDHFFFLCTFEVSMKKLIVELTDKWNGILNQKDALIGPEKQAIALMTAAMENSITDSRKISQSALVAGEEIKKKIGEKKIEAIKNLSDSIGKTSISEVSKAIALILATTLGGMSGLIVAVVLVSIKEVAKALIVRSLENAKQLNAAADQYRDLIIKTGYPIGMFRTNKDLVTRYRLEADLKKLEATNVAALAGLKNRRDYFDRCQLPPTMLKDCDTFATTMTEQFRLVFERCVRMNTEFETQFHGVFEGAAKDTTIERLTDAKLFEREIASTVHRVDYREPRREVQKLLPAAQTIMVGAINMATDPSDLPEEAKVLMISRSAEFRRELDRQFDDQLKRSVDDYLAAIAKEEEAAAEALKKLDRKVLTDGVK